MKVMMLILGLVIVATLGYFTWYVGAEQEAIEEIAPKVAKDTASEAIEVAESNAVACGEKAYAFELTFGELWKGHKIKEVTPNYAIITCYITMPTTSLDPIWTAADTDHDAKYASVFAVSVYTPAQWTASQEEPNKPTELGHNANYYWGWSQAQAIPTDLEAVYADAKNVVATFKIAP